MFLHLSDNHVRLILGHALEALPEECCGLLAGVNEADCVTVRAVHRAANVWAGDRTRRFQIDPLAQLRLQRQYRERGLDIVGFYHSHPDGRPVPSAFDAEMAWPGLLQVIVAPPGLDAESPSAPGPGDVRCWQFDERKQGFEELPIRVV